jgi:hypothetical protein
MLDGSVAGPYPEDLRGVCPPEIDNFFGAPSPNDKNDPAARVHWKSVPHSFQGIVDFRPLMENRDHVSAYAQFPIYSLDERQIAILIGTDDRVRLWLNGTLLHESLRLRTATHEEDAIPARLKSGWNALLVRVANEAEYHELYLRLSDAAVDLARLPNRSQ